MSTNSAILEGLSESLLAAGVRCEVHFDYTSRGEVNRITILRPITHHGQSATVIAGWIRIRGELFVVDLGYRVRQIELADPQAVDKLITLASSEVQLNKNHA